ncbi:hypothetical protein [Spirosoma oryzicola]|uniref:hypothetical protein n=1 Tax=Spirosoma oryzicola TaxID=2898794 RepID=UPI001E47E2C7|nr:hypothetical protein [Spirosoma oryzicola]UHG94296.1 hypothetical protein LQ777_26540 [Spirosoma oryzicola]
MRSIDNPFKKTSGCISPCEREGDSQPGYGYNKPIIPVPKKGPTVYAKLDRASDRESIVSKKKGRFPDL